MSYQTSFRPTNGDDQSIRYGADIYRKSQTIKTKERRRNKILKRYANSTNLPLPHSLLSETPNNRITLSFGFGIREQSPD